MIDFSEQSFIFFISYNTNVLNFSSKSVSSSGSSSKSAGTTRSGGYEWYTIKKGDTLLGIAYKFSGVSLNDILRLNGLNKNSKIYPGRKIKIRKL